MKTILLIIAVVGSALIGPVRAEDEANPLDKDTAALWNFSEGSGIKTQDEGPSGIVLTLKETGGASQWENGKHGSGLRFPGRLQSDPSTNPIELGDAVTVEAWIKIDSAGVGKRMGIFESMVYEKSGFRLEIDKSGRVLWELQKPGKEQALYSEFVIFPEEWTHVAATYDGLTMKIYVNGDLDAERSETGSILSPNTSDIFIGFANCAEGANFRGIIDSVRISRIAKETFGAAGGK